MWICDKGIIFGLTQQSQVEIDWNVVAEKLLRIISCKQKSECYCMDYLQFFFCLLLKESLGLLMFLFYFQIILNNEL